MVHILGKTHSVINNFIAELRDVEVQKDRMRFRRNLERIGEIAAYEISKLLPFEQKEIQTPLGIADCKMMKEQPVLATILRAGLPLHQGLLNYFDKADNAFVAAYRKHHRDGSFEIEQQYFTSPDLSGKALIIADPMLATGSSLEIALNALIANNIPAQIHVVSVIACTVGIDHIRRKFPEAWLWMGAVDDELTAK